MSQVDYRISETETRPAVIVKEHDENCVNLQVFVDGSSDSGIFTPEQCACGLAWRTSVVRGDGIGQWQPPPEPPPDEDDKKKK
ncbi:MAG: hypothetical protein Q8J64_06490 [Thermodesulfovibrionales bacterium]|nr:hypothetical protein [Thermodesulfovibrionales bacterium]